MKKLILFLLLIPSLVFAGSIQSAHKSVIARQGIAGGGSSAFSSGALESFESGAGQFDTTGWTESDTDGVISTYDSTYAKCGSYGLKITVDTDNASSNYSRVDLGSEDSDIYMRWYLGTSASTFGAYTTNNLITFLDASLNTVASVNVIRSDAGAFIRISGTSAPSEKIDLSVVKNHWIDVRIVGSGGNITAKVFEDDGTAVETSNGGGDYELLITTNNYDTRYISINDAGTGGSNTSIFYIDAIEVDMDGSGFIGGVTCP